MEVEIGIACGLCGSIILEHESKFDSSASTFLWQSDGDVMLEPSCIDSGDGVNDSTGTD